MPCEGCEFPAITGLVEGEEDDTQLGFVAESVEQRLKCMDIVRLSGYVCPHVPAETLKQSLVMVSEGSRMDLHHQPIFEAHSCHFGKHLSAEHFRFFPAQSFLQCLCVEGFAFSRFKIRSHGTGMPMVCGSCSHRLEKGSSLHQCIEIPRPIRGIFSG